MIYDHWLLSGPGGPYDCSQPDRCSVCNGDGCEECHEEDDAMAIHTFFQDKDPQAKVNDHTRLRIGNTVAVVELNVDGNMILIHMRSVEAVISLAAKLQQSAANFVQNAYVGTNTHANATK